MEPIDHPPGHEIERLNESIDDAEWTPVSCCVLLVVALPFVIYGLHLMIAGGVLLEVLIVTAIVGIPVALLTWATM